MNNNDVNCALFWKRCRAMERNEPTLIRDLVRDDIEGHLVELTLEPNHETCEKKQGTGVVKDPM